MTGFIAGIYYFRLVNKCADGIYASDLVKVTVLPFPGRALAGSDDIVCNLNPYPLNANAVEAPLMGTWSSLNGGTFSDIHNANATFTPPAQGIYALVWTLDNGICNTKDTVNLNVSIVPAVSAGPDQTLSCKGPCAQLAGSNPGVYPQSGFWTRISGPAGVTSFTDVSKPNSRICGLVPGTYVLRWSVDGPCQSGYDDMILTVTDVSSPPVLGVNKSYPDFCFGGSASSVVLSGTALLAGQTGLWTIQTKPAGATDPVFTPNNAAVTTVTGINYRGRYVFKWTVTDASGCTASQTHTINAESTIPAYTISYVTLPCGATSTYQLGSFTGGFNSPNRDGTSRLGKLLSQPAGASATITKGSSFAGWNFNNMTVPGSYLFRIAYTNSCNTIVNDIKITVSQPPGLVNAGSDIVLPCNNLTANPIGSGPPNPPYVPTWIQISGPNTATLGNINSYTAMTMSNLVNGVYVMRLTTTGGSTCAGSYDDTKVIVTTSPPALANAGADATVCYGNYPLNGNIPQTNETGTWTVDQPTGITYSPNANDSRAIAMGLAPDTTYTFTWTITNACGSVQDQVIITTTNVQGPNVPNAGIDQCLDNTGSFPLNGNAPDAGVSPLWTALTPGSSVSPINSQNTTATVTGGAGTYKFLYSLGVAGCTTLSDTVIVSIRPSGGLSANAGLDQQLCQSSLPTSTTVTGSAIPSGYTVKWTQTAGPNAAIIASPATASTGISNLIAGQYEFSYEVISGACSVIDFITISVSKTPTTANAGPDQSICNATSGTIVTLNGNAPGTGETSYWTLVSAPPGAPDITNSTQNMPSTNISNLVTGTYVLKYVISSGIACTPSEDFITVNIVRRANAGADFTLCMGTETQLYGNTNSNGVWSYVSSTPSGLPAPNLSTMGLPDGTVRVSGLQVPTTISRNLYTFRYTVPEVGTCAATTDDIIVTVLRQPTTANAGPDKFICANASSTTFTSLATAPVVTDGYLRFVSGPSNPFGSTEVKYTDGAGNISPITLSGLVPGIYRFADSIRNGTTCPPSVDYINIIQLAQANAGRDTAFCAQTGESYQLNGNIPVGNLGTWSQVSGPSTIVFVNPNDPKTTFTGWVAGDYVFKWTINNPTGCPINEDIVNIHFDAPITGLDAGSNYTFCQGEPAPFQIGFAPESGVSYRWTPGLYLSNQFISNPIFNGVNSSGVFNYSLTATRGACSAVDEMEIILNPKPLAYLKWAGSGCNPVNFTAENAGTGAIYNWTFGPNASPSTATGIGPHIVTFSGQEEYIASLTVTSPAGCLSTYADTSKNQCFTLPVRLLDFSVANRQNNALITWNIADPVSFSHFELQRSYDGATFDDIAEITWNPANVHYSYTDMQIAAAARIVYYRLKMVDLDGSYHYGPIRNVLRQAAIGQITAYPNPFLNEFTLHTPYREHSMVQVRLNDMNGKVVLDKQYQIQDQQIKINALNDLNPGVYILKVFQDDIIETIRINKIN